MDLSSIISTGLNLGAQLLSAGIFGKNKKDSSIYQTGDLQWMVYNNQPDVYNRGVDDVSLLYAIPSGGADGRIDTKHVVLGPRHSYNPQQDVEDCKLGDISIASMATSAAKPNVESAISFAIKVIALGIIIKMLGGVSFSIFKRIDGNQTRYGILLTITSVVRAWRIGIRASDNVGNTVTANLDSIDAKKINDSDFEILLPEGLEPTEDLLNDFGVDVILDEASFQKLVDENGSRNGTSLRK